MSEKVLVVDDQEINREIMKVHLAKAGYKIVTAEDGYDALEKVNTEYPDIILLDIMMPRMDGFETCRILKEQEMTKEIPIIIITALEDLGHKITGLEMGADEFLTKPVNKWELLTRVKSLLKIRKAAKEMAEQLRLAEVIISGILPPVQGRINGVEYIAQYWPATVLGGDLYFIQNLGKEKVAIIIADVAGHGIASALITMSINTVLSSWKEEDWSAGAALEKLNHYLCRNIPDYLYATACAVIIDVKNQKIQYSNAGHPPPILIKCQAHKTNTFITLESGGQPIGIFCKNNYENYEIEIQGDQILFLYTDGVFELLFNNELELHLKLAEIIVRAKNANEVFSRLSINDEHKEKFTGRNLSDDITLLAIDIVGDSK